MSLYSLTIRRFLSKDNTATEHKDYIFKYLHSKWEEYFSGNFSLISKLSGENYTALNGRYYFKNVFVSNLKTNALYSEHSQNATSSLSWLIETSRFENITTSILQKNSESDVTTGAIYFGYSGNCYFNKCSGIQCFNNVDTDKYYYYGGNFLTTGASNVKIHFLSLTKCSDDFKGVNSIRFKYGGGTIYANNITNCKAYSSVIMNAFPAIVSVTFCMYSSNSVSERSSSRYYITSCYSDELTFEHCIFTHLGSGTLFFSSGNSKIFVNNCSFVKNEISTIANSENSKYVTIRDCYFEESSTNLDPGHIYFDATNNSILNLYLTKEIIKRINTKQTKTNLNYEYLIRFNRIHVRR